MLDEAVIDPDASILLTLRNLAMQERDEATRTRMRAAADNIQSAMLAASQKFSCASMSHLNSMWAYGLRTIGAVTLDRPPGGAGLTEGAALAIAA